MGKAPLLIAHLPPQQMRGHAVRLNSVFVAQISSLPYRRLLVGNHTVTPTPADWKSATRQVGNLRYELRPTKKWDAVDNDLILELAVASASSYIITHNRRDFRDAEHFGLRVVTPGEFLRTI
jgi:hypothetical protein